MSLNVQIEILNDTDFDGLPIQIKVVTPYINGEPLQINYSFPDTEDDANIISFVENDLSSKGYTW